MSPAAKVSHGRETRFAGCRRTTLKGIESIMERQKQPTEAVSFQIVAPGTLSVTMTHNDGKRRAHELYRERGCKHGHDMDHWLQAEREVNRAVNVASA
jgi:hypothetical protein